ncbi:MAG: sugar ABC transporter ATP-binding protein [Clostridia bacterium]|nr:sugar ABC transporter ATP-binding protein [Clostridia bacterium]
MKQEVLLEMRGICKSFPGVRALKGVGFRVRTGEVHALMGENGAGKSTLIKILTGIYTKDSGEIYFDGKAINPSTSLQAQQCGISTIYQELNLVPYLSVCENIFLGREPKKFGVIDWKAAEKQAEKILEDMGVKIDVKQPLNKYSTAIQQMVSIARAISINSKLVVMDEPTSSLDEKEVKVLFNVIRRLKQHNISVVFISHRLDEIFEICDNITILKDGDFVGEYSIKELTKIDLISKMIGRDASAIVKYKKDYSASRITDKVVCKAKNIYKGVRLSGIDLEIKEGEVVGLAGLLGSGRTELAKIIFGSDMHDQGEIEVCGKKVKFRLPKDAISMNFAFCSEDRKIEGIIPHMSVRENMTLATLPRLSRFGVVSRRKQDEIVEKYIKRLGIKTPHADQKIRNLSGGNQQKVLLARWLCMHPKLVILDEPTRGIDVGAKSEIERLIQEMSAEGISVLMISSELEELVRGCDRIAVIRDGRKVKELVAEEISEESIMEAIAKGRDTLADSNPCREGRAI